jgi:hypothetical protein
LEVSVRITRKYGDCSDGTCPAIMETDNPEVVAFQGARLTDPEALGDVGDVPAHEGVVLLPRALVDEYLRSRS